MKPKSALRSLLLAGSTLLAISYSHAATVNWDTAPGTVGAGDSTLTGGAGTWNTSNGNWTANAGVTNIAWVNGSDTAVFSGAASTLATPVALGSNITVGGLQFDTTAYFIDTTGSFAMTFGAANNTILLNNIAAATINGTVGGSGSNVILKASVPSTAGTLTLGQASAGGWSGTTTINQGTTLALKEQNLALASTTGITLNGGGITLTNTNSTEGAYDRVASTGITSNGGTITCTNTSGASNNYAETIGTPVLTSGQLNLVLTTNQASSQILTLGGLNRSNTTTTVAFASGGGLNATTNQIVVTGATPGFIGPWAVAGTSIAASFLSDYATYNASAQVVPANIAATPETDPSWVAGANVTLSSATPLTATRTVNTLRYTGGTATLDLGNFNLQTYGFLSGGSGAPTIGATGSGVLTTPTGGDNKLYLALSRNMTVSAPINDNGNPVTLVQGGIGLLTLSSTTSTYSGGTVLNGATNLTITADSNLGATTGDLTFNGTSVFSTGSITLDAGRTVTINSGALVTTSQNMTLVINGALEGSGVLRLGSGTAAQHTLTSTSNTFTGDISNLAGINATSITANSLGDGGTYYLGSTSNYGSGTFTYGTGAGTTIAALNFNNRQFVLGGQARTGGFDYSNLIRNNSDNGSNHTITINTDMIIGGVASVNNRRLALGGTNTDENKFTGKLGDGTGTLATEISSLLKQEVGTWAVSGASTFTGSTTLKGGTLVTNSLANAGSASPIGASNDTSFGMGLVLSGGTLKYAPVATLGAAGHSTNRNFIIATGSTIDASGTGALQFTNTGTLSPDLTGQSVTATSGSGAVTVPSTAGLAEGMRVRWNGGTSTLYTVGSIDSATQITLTGNVSLADAGSFADATYGYPTARTLNLTGTNTGANTIAGILQNSSASGAGVLSLTKAGTGTWVLSNANTHTGATTSGGGILKLNNANALPGGNGLAGGTSNLTIAGGGIVGLTAASGDFLRARGTTATQVQWTGSGGFAAYGGDRVVRLADNVASTATWNNGSFVPGAQSLILSAADSDGTLIWENSINFAGSVRTIQVNNGSAAIDARISGQLTGGSASGPEKTGAGTLELTSTASDYAGATTVTDGTLRLGASNVLPDSTNVTIAAATLQVGAGFTDTVGTLDVTAAAATINLGAGATLVFADSNGVDWTDTDPDGTLNITGSFVSGSSIKFATSGGLTGGQLAAITINGVPGSYTLDGSGFLVSGAGPGPLDHFAISAISSPQTVGTPITGITLTAQDAANQTVTSFTGTVNFGGTGGFTGTSGNFSLGVLSGVSVTPTNSGSGLTFTVTDIGSGKSGTATITTIQTQYQAWAGGAGFDADANGDGVKNGLAFLLGASGPSSAVTLPTATQSSGNLVLNFTCLNDAKRGTATLNVQQSSDLGIADAWLAAPVTDAGSAANGVTFSVTPGSPSNTVTATISSSQAVSGKLFGRLKANNP